jgi:pyrroloquinoline quinone biosynthesis protein D
MIGSGIDAASRPVIERRFRLQWEPAQNAHVLLYPEGMIKLNASAGEILKRCTGEASIGDITADLERAFATTGLAAEVLAFIELAIEKQWLVLPPAVQPAVRP